MMKPANDFRPGFGIAVVAYLCGATAIMLPAVAIFLIIGLLLILRVKARGNGYLSSHLKALLTSSTVILIFNMIGSIALHKIGIISLTQDPENPTAVIDSALMEEWLPLITITFLLYLCWTIPRLVTGIKLLRKGYSVQRAGTLSAVLRSA